MLLADYTKTRKPVWEAYNGRLVAMRQSGASLQQIGDETGVTKERIRQLLAEHYGKIQIPLLTERKAAQTIGCNAGRLEELRKQGMLNPKRMGGRWLYDRDELEKAMLLLQRFCAHCGAPVPMALNKLKYCVKCSRDSRRNYWPFLSEDAKRVCTAAHLSWQKRHPERYRELQGRAASKFEEKMKREHYATTLYVVVSEKAILPLNSIVKAVGCENTYLILVDGSRIPIKHVRKLLRRHHK